MCESVFAKNIFIYVYAQISVALRHGLFRVQFFLFFLIISELLRIYNTYTYRTPARLKCVFYLYFLIIKV